MYTKPSFEKVALDWVTNLEFPVARHPNIDLDSDAPEWANR